MVYPAYGHYTLPDPRDRREPLATQVMTVKAEHVPDTFDMAAWEQRASFYLKGWQWFGGGVLSERAADSSSIEPIFKYPLAINSVRNFARKHASILLGEETFDSPSPLVKCIVRPRNPLDGTKNIPEEEKKLALICQNIINSVWSESKGRALQMENAILSQFLGGCVFQVSWQPELKYDRLIPITIKNVMPDFFLPVWENDDPWNLLESFVVYRIPKNVARKQYDISLSGYGWVTYCEHWTRKTCSILIDGKPLKSAYSGEMITYKDVPNAFGFVPYVYIPHLREGSFWGHGHVEDIEGLLRELNARAADMGDAIQATVHRKRYAVDVAKATPLKLDDSKLAINLGNTNAATKATPKVWAEDPPDIPAAIAGFPDWLFKQLLREAYISPIAFGEDEGSQRSALTLAFRMWPSTSHARAERTFWTDGLNQIAKYILQMVVAKMDFINEGETIINTKLPPNFMRKLQFAQDWKPQIPRDREQMVNEVAIRKQSKLISSVRAIEMLGDVEYVEDEWNAIKEEAEWEAKLGIKPEEVNPQLQKSGPTSGLGDSDSMGPPG